MENFYIHSESGDWEDYHTANFGDVVNKRFWETFIGDNISVNRQKEHYITTGSIISFCNRESIVFGSGFLHIDDSLGTDWNKKETELPKEVIAVRGPLTRKKIIEHGVSCPEVYGDPLIMLPAIYHSKTKPQEKLVGILPHYGFKDSESENIQKLKSSLTLNGYDVKVLTMEVGDDYEKIIEDISECSHIVTSALHGVILGLAYNVKTILVDFSEIRLTKWGRKFKYDDFLLSFGSNYQIKNIFDFTILDNTIDIDIEKIKSQGANLISHCPFIKDKRKLELLKNYLDFYKNNRIALFTTVNHDYIDYAIRCFEIFNDKNPGKFDFFIVTNDSVTDNQIEKLLSNKIELISLNLNDVFKNDFASYPSECFWYYKVPNILLERGYEFSMYVDCDTVCLSELDFSWLSNDFVLAGSPRMRNDLSEEIDAWYFLEQVKSKEELQFIENNFSLKNKNNIIDIHTGVLVFNNQKWYEEGLFEKSLDVFNKCKDNGYTIKGDDTLLTMLQLTTSKSYYKYLDVKWNWYYEDPNNESMGGEDANILHMIWVKPWSKNKITKNRNIQRGLSIWNKKKENMRLHIVGVPRNPSTPTIAMDPYAMVSYYLTTYLHRGGHEVHYYGFKESTVECTKNWGIVNKEHHEKYNVTNPQNHWGISTEGDSIFNNAATQYLCKNIQEGDIVICMWSSSIIAVKSCLDKKPFNVNIVDGHIGHRHPTQSTPFHVFASHANRHFVYGMNLEGFSYWHDTVIYPMANDLNNFTYKEKKKDYFLFMGRLNSDKGIGIFFNLAKHFKDKQFILAGQGAHNWDIPPNMKEAGYLNPIQRKEYLSNAKAVISPSHYAEPFGLTAVEAGLSGTPIICTDHGGYTETVVEGLNGYRCSYFNDFVNAVNNIDKIKPKDCRNFAEKFSAESLIKDWEKYLHRINREGWYTLD